MNDSRKHLPGSLSEPGYDAPFLGSADAQLSSRGKHSSQLLSELARGHFIRKVNVPVQVYRSHNFCLNYNLTLTLQSVFESMRSDGEGGFTWSFEGRTLTHSHSSSCTTRDLGSFSNIRYSMCTFTNVYTIN